MIGQFFEACSCFSLFHEDVTELPQDWSDDAEHYLQTQVSLIWNTDSEELTCLQNYSGNIHLTTGSPYYSQLVILLKEQRFLQTYLNGSGNKSPSTGTIEHQSTPVGSQGQYDFSLAPDDVLKNVIVILDFDESLGIWHGETATAFGGEQLAKNWIFEFHPDFRDDSGQVHKVIRNYFGAFGSPSTDLFSLNIDPINFGDDITLGRFQLDENCNSIGVQSGITLPQFMRNRPKEYLLVLPSDITFTGNIDGTAYTDHVVMSAGSYSFTNRCITTIDCAGSFGGIQFVYGNCLCEPYKFDEEIYYFLPSAVCNDPDAISISHGTLRFGESDTVSLYFGGDQGWTGNQFAYADWKIKTGTNIDYYGDSTIEPKLNESSSTLTLPSEAIIRFNGFGL